MLTAALRPFPLAQPAWAWNHRLSCVVGYV